MPTIQVPQYEMRVYSVVGLKLDGITPEVTVEALVPLNPFYAQVAISGQAPNVSSGLPTPAGAAVTAGTDAEFINTGDMRLIMAGQQPDALDSADFPIVYPGVGSLGLDENSPVRGFGLQLQGLVPSVTPIAVSMGIDNYSLDGLQIVTNKLPSVGQDALAAQGLQPQLLFSELPKKVSPQNAEADLLGQSPDLLLAGAESPGAGAVQITGRKPEILLSETPHKASPQNAEAILLGLEPDILLAGKESPGAGAAQITGRKPEAFQTPPKTVVPQDYPAIISGLTPDAIIAGVEYPGVGAAAIDGLQPQIIEKPGALRVSPQDVPATISGLAPEASVSGGAFPGVGAAELGGLQLTVIQIAPTKKVSPQDGALATSGKQLGDILTGLKVPAGALTLVETNAGIGLQPRPGYQYLAIAGRVPTAELSGTKALIGTIIENTNATTDVPTNYQICDITGFKVAVDEPFVKDWRGYYSRKKSHTERHPQDFVKGVPENRHGSESPEPEDEFIDDLYPSGVTTDDL